MLRRTAVLGFALALGLPACKGSGEKSAGPVLAKGDGVEITAGDFRTLVAEQQPFQRAQLAVPGKRKAILNRMVQEQVLFRQAEKEGLRDDPQVQKLLKTIMIQRLMSRHASQTDPATIPAAEVDKYFQEHAGEYQKRVAGSLIAFLAAPGSAERAAKRAAADKALAALRDAERKSLAAAPQPAALKPGRTPPPASPAASAPAALSVSTLFSKLVNEQSDDQATKRFGGSVGFKTREELEKSLPAEVVAQLFQLPQNEISNVIETPQGYYIARVTAVREAFGVEQVRPQIQVRLARQMDEKAWTSFVEKLQADANVTIDEKALEAVEVPPVEGGAAAVPAHAHPAPPAAGQQATKPD